MLLRLAQNSRRKVPRLLSHVGQVRRTRRDPCLRGVAEAKLWPIAARLQAASLTRFQGAIDKAVSPLSHAFFSRWLHVPFAGGRLEPLSCARYQYIIPGGVPNRHPWGTGECSLIGIHPVLIAVLHPSCSTLTFFFSHLSFFSHLLFNPQSSITYSVSVQQLYIIAYRPTTTLSCVFHLQFSPTTYTT